MAEAHYLVGLDLTGRRVVVIGGGTVAQRRVPRLLGAGAKVEAIAPHTTPAVSGMADEGSLVWHERAYADGDLDGAWYVLACSDVTEVNAAVCA
ncbi:MAG: precorrin-2 dehydrogenase/sirohydrochlorin ferrochelatase family protein, partial [Haloechinothrix sp.]